mgnify:CR=1 FL=1
MNKKNSKGKYQTSIGNNSIALTMDLLRDSYRIREKMFPAKISIGKGEQIVYKTLYELAEKFDAITGFPDVFRYDLDGNLIKRHIYREINK